MSAPIASPRHFPLLDAGRGVAALAVLAHHIGNEAGVPLAPYGYLAVDFFLMLSGFVVAQAYEPGLRAGLPIRSFLAIRAKRLYPMILLGGLLACAAWALRPNPDIRPAWLLLQFALIPAMACWVTFPLNAPLWSLMYECVANAVHGALLAFWPARALAWTLLPLTLGALAIVWVWGDYNWGFRPGEEWPALVRVFAAYVAGMLLSRLHRAGRLPTIRAGSLAPMLPILAPLLAPGWIGARIVVPLALLACFPLAILLGLGATPVRAGLALSRWLGGISYPLYAIHMPLMVAALAVGWPGGWGWAAWGVLAVLAADLAERFYDAPLRRWLKSSPPWQGRVGGGSAR